ncbi:hypothetical protein PGT21_020987 [Puccinia graminis f. sp. tritici]|uniref:Uncharacterized protein n=1 Tax=Puccinia graminis f. sp. tritici TaxID=56615 RepID=A0A5B0LKV6_PUCGR|nr:hypothetical protein PGT21_020987 [Puccinia graminis f. sp. tritici]KAA1071118.1 hypothetical protein PGTUg99_016968 [Puccinia graminis f. sp. tritici]
MFFPAGFRTVFSSGHPRGLFLHKSPLRSLSTISTTSLISPTSDAAFKRIFNKHDLLLKLLNIILEKKKVVVAEI